MNAFNNLQPTAGIASACVTLGINRAGIYRQRAPIRHTMPPKPRARSALALCATERQDIIEILDSERFVDVAPATIYATLLDESRYHGSVRTMYRVLKSAQQTGERRRQHKHPLYTKPELLARQSNEVWSWDITKLKGPIKWSYFHRYVILDIFSRYVFGWIIAPRETAELAKQLSADTVEKQNIDPGTLTLHADRGTSMRSKPVAALLVDLDVAKTHSRPHISDDNPYSEAQFKTLKYRPTFPERFGSIEDARAHCREFFQWYNSVHRHSGIGYMTPHAIHHREAIALNLQRAETLNAAFIAHPRALPRHRAQATRAAHRRSDQSTQKGDRTIHH